MNSFRSLSAYLMAFALATGSLSADIDLLRDNNTVNSVNNMAYSSDRTLDDQVEVKACCRNRCNSCRGATGPTGPTGLRGQPGPTGATGIAGAGAIIPFASGLTPVVLISVLDIGEEPAAQTAAAIGFGANVPIISVLDSLNIAAVGNVAFTVPVDGTITDVAAYFSSTVAAALLGTTVQAQLYESTGPNNIFTPIAETLVTLAPGIPLVALGATASGIVTGLDYQVLAGTRLLLVFSVDGGSIPTTATGYASGGVHIAGPGLIP